MLGAIAFLSIDLRYVKATPVVRNTFKICIDNGHLIQGETT
jgi:hypothetical protein